MSRIVQIQGAKPAFPGDACVHCLKPSMHKIEIMRVNAQGIACKIEMPFCDECIALRQAKTPRQVQFERLSVSSSALLAATTGVWVFTRVDNLGRWMWGALLGILVAWIVFGILYMLIQPWAAGFCGPETRAVLKAVSIREFNWDTTTLEFANEEYAGLFAQINHKE